MQPPKVQDLTQILAEIDPAFTAQRNVYTQQQAAIPGQTTASKSALEAAKNNAFNQVNTNANAKGMAFSGIPGEEQATYLGEKYLPGMMKIDEDARGQGLQLQLALAQLEGDRQKQAMGIRSGQQSTLDQYLENERQRQFQAQQAAMERAAASSAAAQADRNPSDDLVAAMNAWFKQNGGAGNKNLTRRQQDNFVENWLNSMGVSKNNRAGYWQRVNTQFNRAADPTKDWRWYGGRA